MRFVNKWSKLQPFIFQTAFILIGIGKNCDMDFAVQIQLLFYGFLAGVLGGLLGIGGGVIYVLVLPGILFELGVPENEIVSFTVANSLFATFFTTLSGNIKQIADKNFYLKQILWISIPGAIVSFLIIHFFVNTPLYSKSVFNIFYVAVVLYLFFRLVNRIYKTETLKLSQGVEKESPLINTFVGIGAGIISPLTGLGGGLVVVPVLHSILNFQIKKANSISLGVIAITAFSSSIVNMNEQAETHLNTIQIGFILIPMVSFLSIGGILGAFLGIELSNKIKSRYITILFAVFLFLVLVKKIFEISHSIHL